MIISLCVSLSHIIIRLGRPMVNPNQVDVYCHFKIYYHEICSSFNVF